VSMRPLSDANSYVADLLIFALGMIILALVQCAPAPAAASPIPTAAGQYRGLLVRSARFEFGLNAPVATLAAQVHQESRWNKSAQSPVGAQGLAQFMPTTAEWMPEVDASLKNPAPFNPGWALRAMARYDKWLLARVEAVCVCEQWAMVLSSYNGGLGWVYRDKRLALASGASELAWFNHVENFNAGRSAANFQENRHYVRVILSRFEPTYHRAGWGPGVCLDRDWEAQR